MAIKLDVAIQITVLYCEKYKSKDDYCLIFKELPIGSGLRNCVGTTVSLHFPVTHTLLC